MTNTPSPPDEDRELIERRIARSLARSDGIPDDAPVGDYARNARDVYREVVESLLSYRAKLEDDWFDKAIRDHADEHGPSGGAWNISMVLERLHRAKPAQH